MYFKILDENMRHGELQYHEGLNTDTPPFNPDLTYGGGLFFVDEKKVLKFPSHASKIAAVTVPESQEIVTIFNGEYKSHEIVLSDIRDFWTVETFEWLTEAGMDIHADSDRLLWMAAKSGYLEIVKYLAEIGTDIHAYNDSALQEAAKSGHLEIVKYLVEAGADIHAYDD